MTISLTEQSFRFFLEQPNWEQYLDPAAAAKNPDLQIFQEILNTRCQLLLNQIDTSADAIVPPQSPDQSSISRIHQIYHATIKEAKAIGLEADLFTSLPTLTRRVQSIKDRDLLTFFSRLNIPAALRPLLDGNPAQNAKIVRTWMTNNAPILNQITSLDLAHLNLMTLPSEIRHLQQLQRLTLRHNPILTFPNGLSLPNLQELDLSNTRLTRLPVDFNPLKLRWLSLENTQVASLPALFNPPNLRTFYLNNTPIAQLPDGFNPENLRKLDLQNSKITALPFHFNPKNLQELYLQNTLIRALPIPFNPPNLNTLDLSNTPIATLPAGFNPKYLRTLNLSNTKISELPIGLNPKNLDWNTIPKKLQFIHFKNHSHQWIRENQLLLITLVTFALLGTLYPT